MASESENRRDHRSPRLLSQLATRHFEFGSPLPLRQLSAGSPGSAGGFEGFVQGGEVAVEQRMEVLQCRLELGSRDLVVLAVRAGRGRRGRLNGRR
jgi:hypothetical protein